MSGEDRAPVWLLATTLALTSLNLRGVVASLGPILRDVQADLGMSDTLAGALTALPVVVFGVLGLAAAGIGRRVGTRRTLVLALLLLSLGTAARGLATTTSGLFVATFLALVGIAVANVLVPVLVKAWFPDDVGRATAWYSTALAVGTAVPAALTVPAATALGGWRPALAVWALPGVVALAAWSLLAARRAPAPAAAVPPAGSSPHPPPEDAAVRRWVRRQPTTWALATYFGLQGLEAYVAIGWLAAILRDAGLSPERAGGLVAAMMLLGLPMSLLLPRLAARRADQRPVVAVLVAFCAAAYLGLLLAPVAAPLLWTLLLGIGLSAFPLALTLLALRSATPVGTAELSTRVQGIGYLIAAAGPLAVGVLLDRTGSWDLPLALLLVLLVPKLVSGLIAARPGVVDLLPGHRVGGGRPG